MELDNAMKGQKTKSKYMEFSRILAHNYNKENRPKIWPNKAILAGQLRSYLVVFGWSKHARKLTFKQLVQVYKKRQIMIGPNVLILGHMNNEWVKSISWSILMGWLAT